MIGGQKKGGDTHMITKKILSPNRVRRISRGFSFIPHRFLTDGFLTSLTQKELLLYFFLALVSDRYGISFYSYDSICSLLSITLDDYLLARDGLIKKNLIAFESPVFQVLDLPPKPIIPEKHNSDPATVQQIIRKSLKGG